MTTSIYLVVGDTGEYSDHTQWYVAAYTTREQAELHRQRLLEACKLTRPASWEQRNELSTKIRAELDPDYIAYDDADYTVMELRLFRHLDEFLETL